MEDNVFTKSIQYENMERRWTLIHDLLGGTQAMRDAGELWLPKEPREVQVDYDYRKSRSVLYNGYANAVDRVVSKPFTKPVVVQGELPEILVGIEHNVDRQGTNLTQFSRKLMHTGSNYG